MQTREAPQHGVRGGWRDSQRQSLTRVVIASVLAIAVTRIWAWSEYLWAWDSVNFALALREIDVQSHQPHPPGYFGFVLLARAVRWGASENQALLRVLLVASTATAVLTWGLTRRMTGSQTAAWTAWALVIFSPLHWFYGAVAEIYAAETAGTTAIAAAAYAVRQQRLGAEAGLALAVFSAALIKVPAVVLMLPLLGFVFVGVSSGKRVLMLVGLGIGSLAALCALATVTSIEAVLATSSGQVGEVASTSFLSGLDPRALNRSLRDILYAAVAAIGPGVVALAALGRVRRPRDAAFLAAWGTPFLLSCALVHFPKPGYLLPVLPVLAIALSAALVGTSLRRAQAVGVLMAILGLVQFALLRPFAASTTGEGRRYADKTLSQRLRTEANSVLRPSLSAVLAADDRVRSFEAALASHCDGAARVLVIVDAGGELTWRHAMFYAPSATTVQLPSPHSALLVAARRRIIDSSDTDALPGDCVGYVRSPGAAPLEDESVQRVSTAALALGTQRLEFHRGLVELVLSPGAPHLR